MITSTLAYGKANASGNLEPAMSSLAKRYASNAAAAASAPSGIGRPGRSQDDPVHQRELFLNVLSANATKRDAKQYLARFKPTGSAASQQLKVPDVQAERNARHRRDQDRLERMGVNLGGLYAPARAIADSPQFVRQVVQEKTETARKQTLHLALVSLRAPETLDDSTLEGLVKTLSQLVKLDVRIVLVLDSGQDASSNVKARRTAYAAQAERLLQALRQHSPDASRFITGALEIASGADGDNVSVATPKLILEPLKRGIIPIVPSLAYTPSGQLVCAELSDVVAALTEELSGQHGEGETGEQGPYETSLDRIIVLDTVGGIPSKDRGDKAHVFINLKQEFEGIEKEMSEYTNVCSKNESSQVYTQHKRNLRTLDRCLAKLSSASSGLIISPHEAASSSQVDGERDSTIGAGTRRQRNTLIHNLLTNKPMVSPSLPTARLSSNQTDVGFASPVTTETATLVKRGMPLTIIPAADRSLGWQHPASGRTTLDLDNDPRIDLPRLVHLINDSFRRKLDVQQYLNRIKGTVAGLIIAGEYEGGAILTWEQPPGTSDPHHLVPYLDKFAVLQSSQGSAGVADILFQAMVRSCFPNGVCWRSRKDNPVNKWYFERAAGSWQIPGTNWTMFWTGEGVVVDEQRWEDYVGVCRSVVPTWADGKKPD